MKTERCRLWIEPNDAERLFSAARVCYLVGGYDGSGNFGDIIQAAAAIRRVRRLSDMLPAVVVDRRRLADHRELTDRHPSLFADCVVVYSDRAAGEPARPDTSDEDLSLLTTSPASEGVALLYGGGFLNTWWNWGSSRLAVLEALRELASVQGTASLPLAVTGQQVSENAFSPELEEGLSGVLASEVLGVRDHGSLDALTRRLEVDGAGRAFFSGDDSATFLLDLIDGAVGGGRERRALNLHVSTEPYVTSDPEALLDMVGSVVERLVPEHGIAEVRLLSVYADGRISDVPTLQRLGERFAGAGLEARVVPFLDALLDGDSRVADTALTIACSYHVALTSLLAGVPVINLYENAYYLEKLEGLARVFDVPGDLHVRIGTGNEDLLQATKRALVDPGLQRELDAGMRRGAIAHVRASAEAESRLHGFLEHRRVRDLEARYLETTDLLRDAFEQISDLRFEREHLNNLVENRGRVPTGKEPEGYIDNVARIRALVARLLPEGAVVGIVSRGDDRLLDIPGRTIWHFPRDATGSYVGFHPAGSSQAIDFLEMLRADGADFLLFPSVSFWWLSHYDAFTQHLESRYERVLDDAACQVYALRRSAAVETIEASIADEEKRLTDLRALLSRLSANEDRHAPEGAGSIEPSAASSPPRTLPRQRSSTRTLSTKTRSARTSRPTKRAHSLKKEA